MRARSSIERDLETFHPSSFGWALHCCRWKREEAEEVLQTAYLKAIDGRARFNGHSSTQTWFFGVVKRTAAERRRYRLVRRLALLSLRQRDLLHISLGTARTHYERGKAQLRKRLSGLENGNGKR